MILKLQILSLSFSFIFGFSFSLFLDISHKIIYSKIKIIKYLGSFIIVFLSVFIYFVILQKINNCNFHPYLLVMIILGFSLKNILYKIKGK